MSTLKIAYVYWKFLGLCPFAIDDDCVIRVSYSGSIYAIILTTIYTILYVRAVTNRTTFSLPRETPMSIIADFSGLSVEFFLIALSWLYFGFHQKKLQKIFLSFKKIHHIYEKLGIRVDNAKLFGEVNVQTIFINVLWYFLCITDHLLLNNWDSFKLRIWIPFNVPRVVNHNIMIMFTGTLRAIEQRFSLLNERIQELPNEVSTKVIDIRHLSSRRDSGPPEFKSFVIPGPLETYGRIHSDLIELAKIVVEFYSLSILLTMLAHSIQMSSGLYTMCLIAKGRTVWPWRDIGSFLILCSWFVLHFCEMVVLVSVSESTTKEANRAGNVLHKMLLASRADRYMDPAIIMSLRLLQRQWSIDLFGLLRMRLSIIHQIMGMVATYTTVMVQLDDQEARKNE